jgi:hypothetical protein
MRHDDDLQPPLPGFPRHFHTLAVEWTAAVLTLLGDAACAGALLLSLLLALGSKPYRLLGWGGAGAAARHGRKDGEI